jgi:hypothetical protein
MGTAVDGLETRRFGSPADAVEAFYEHGWSDGLPVVPPTRSAVDAMLAAGRRPGGEILGTLDQREVSLTVAQAAACAVMAGCKPAYFPVVLATWDALFDERFNLHAVLSSTGGPAIMAVVSGPVVDRLGMNATANVFGPGNRPNATIGRAIRLAAMSSLEAVPGELDASSFGHAGKYTFHFGERAPAHGWPSVREQLGFPWAASTVTVMAAEAPRQIAQRLNPSAEGLLATVASCMRNPSQGGTGKGTYYVVVLGPEHEYVLATAGLSPADVRAALADRSRVTEEDLAAAGVLIDRAPMYGMAPGTDGKYRTADSDCILVVTAGGHGAGWSAAIPCWTGVGTSHPVTRPILAPSDEIVVASPVEGGPGFA